MTRPLIPTIAAATIAAAAAISAAGFTALRIIDARIDAAAGEED